MKSVKVVIATLALGLITFAGVAAPKVVNVNKSASSIAWLAKKVTGEHNGTVGISAGALNVNGNKLIGGNQGSRYHRSRLQPKIHRTHHFR
jgi:hypothetical protein